MTTTVRLATPDERAPSLVVVSVFGHSYFSSASSRLGRQQIRPLKTFS
jgi:hypothetical protein